MTKFYFIRHGEQDWDIIEKYKLKGQAIDLMPLMDNGVYPKGEIRPWETKQDLMKRFDSVLIKYLNYNNVVVVAHAEIFASLIPKDEILHCSILDYTKV